MTPDDGWQIEQIMSLYGHVLDDHDWPRLPDVFTADAVIDLSRFGMPSMTGFDEIAVGMDGRTVFAHHATNVVVVSEDGDTAKIRSKYLAVSAAGVMTGEYLDDVVRTPAGWRIKRRDVRAITE